MKLHPIAAPFVAYAVAAALLGAAANPGSAAESESKSKSKSSSAETKKSDAKKSETKKSDAKKSDSTKTKAVPAEVKRANEVLDQLSTSQKAALTKLINGGTKKELTSLPGVGDTIADAIIKARPLESAAYLVTVDGVGEKTFAEIVKSRK